MPASRIDSVDLNTDGRVTIRGSFTEMTGRKVTLLHIWLAQQGTSAGPDGTGAGPGVGLAVDALADNTFNPRGAQAFNHADHSFAVVSFGAAYSDSHDTSNAPFRPGPAVVSAIAVVSPVPPNGVPPVVLEWSRMLTLPASGETEDGETIEEPPVATPSSSS